jgi:hypothetical protein
MTEISKERQELFKKRWKRYQKMGPVGYGLFLGCLYAFVLFSISVLYDYNQGDLPFEEIATYINGELLIKTGVFFVFGLVFGIYHFRKSQRKFNNGL